MAVELALRLVGLAELQILVLADLCPCHDTVAIHDGGGNAHDFGIEPADRLSRAARHVEFDIGHAERDAPEPLGVRFKAAQAVAPGANGLDVIVVFAIAERGAFQLGRDRGEPREQRLPSGDHDCGVAAQHLWPAARQMKLAAAGIHPHVAVGDHQIGIAGQPDSGDIEQRGEALVRHLHVDMLEMDGVAEIFCGAIEWLLHGAAPWMRCLA